MDYHTAADSFKGPPHEQIAIGTTTAADLAGTPTAPEIGDLPSKGCT